MLEGLRPRLTFANVMSVIAVFIALGGASYAVTLAKNSVGAKQIKKNAVRGAEIKSHAVGGAEIKSDAVGGAEIGSGQVGSGEVAEGSLVGDDIADGTLGSADILDGSLGSGDVADNSLGPDDVNGLQSGDIADGSLVEGDFAAGQLGPEAYARVQANGTVLPLLDSALPSTSTIDPGDISNPQPGVYCFDNLGFDPATAMVTSDNVGAMTSAQNSYVMGAAVERGNGLNGCVGQQVRIVTTRVAGAGSPPVTEDHAFIIWLDEGVPGQGGGALPPAPGD